MCTETNDTTVGADFVATLIVGTVVLAARGLWWAARRVVVPLLVLVAVATWQGVRAVHRSGRSYWQRRQQQRRVLVGDVVPAAAITAEPAVDMRWPTLKKEVTR